MTEFLLETHRLEIQGKFPTFVFPNPPRIILAILDILYPLVSFRMRWPVSTKKKRGVCLGLDLIESVDQLEDNRHVNNIESSNLEAWYTNEPVFHIDHTEAICICHVLKSFDLLTVKNRKESD